MSDVKTILIDSQIKADLTITNTNLYDVLMLPQSEGKLTGGRIIFDFGSSSNAGFDEGLESFGLSLGKDNVTLSIGGNYVENSDPDEECGNWRWDGRWLYDYPHSFGGTLSSKYNINHLSYNDNYVAGTVWFESNNAYLVLTAQNGAAQANKYSKSETDPDKYKADDLLAFRSANYGIWCELDGDKAQYADINLPAKPGTITEHYNFLAKGTLTVKSDLAGIYETVTAGVHTGYYTVADSKNTYHNDSSDNRIIGAGFKAENLVLLSNFRATIKTLNNSGTYEEALAGQSGLKRENGKVISGTTIAGYASPTANNNTIANYGITVGTLKTAENTIWAGSITAETKNVSIFATPDDLAPGEEAAKEGEEPKTRDASSASATGNKIEAYGIKADESLVINEMGSLTQDEFDKYGNPTVGGTKVDASIKAYASNNVVNATAEGDKDKAATASLGVDVTAAGIYASNTLELGKVSRSVKIEAYANDNDFTSKATSGKTTHYSVDVKIDAYGIYATSAEFTNFDGSITAQTIDNDIEPGGTKTSHSFSETAAGIYVKDTLTSESNLCGDIKVNGSGVSLGIYGKTITVNGVIDSDITVSNQWGIGLYVAKKLEADAFSGDISVREGSGISINSDISGVTEQEAFDITGNIDVGWYGIVSLGAMNIRVAGKIESSEYAICSEYSLATNHSGHLVEEKGNDQVEIAAGAYVEGNIDLGAGVNEVIISSNAVVKGKVLATSGEVNLTFNLEGEAATTPTLYVDELNENDKTLKDSATITVNLNYAEEGTYTLIKYNFNASEFWQNDEIAFIYQGSVVNVSSDKFGFGEDKGAELIDRSTGEVLAKVFAEFTDKNELKVAVKEKQEKTKAITEADWGEIKQSYDAENAVLSLDWKDVFKANDYGFITIAGYEVEYRLYDEKDNVRGAEAGEANADYRTVVASLGGNESSYDIRGVDNNTQVKWRVRLLGDISGNSATAWSEWKTVTNQQVLEGSGEITTFVETPEGFDLSGFSSKTADAVSAASNDVVAAIAELSWSPIASANPIRYYVIKYCTKTEQITQEMVNDYNLENQTDYTLEEYIANAMDNEMTYTKVITGTQVAVSDLQNQSYLYWKIQAIDVTGAASDWVAGQTCRVWANADTSAPIFEEGKTDTSFIVDFVLPDAEDDVTVKTAIKGAIGWHAAVDSESGVQRYNIYLSTDDGKTFGESPWKTIQAEDLQKYSFGSWQDDSLDADTEYMVWIGDEPAALANVTVSTEYDKEVKTLNWSWCGDLTDKDVTVKYKDKDGVWQDLTTLASGKYEFKSYDYTVSLEGLTGPQYNFRITAVDYYGHESIPLNAAPIVLDSKAPAFTSDKCDVVLEKDTSNPEKITITPTFTWSPAEDYVSDQGVRYYEVLYREPGKEEWISAKIIYHDKIGEDGKFSYTFDKALLAQAYDYKIVAYDYFGRTDEITGSFGSSDVKPPAGSFDGESFNAKVTASVTEKFNELIDEETGEVTKIPAGYTVNSAQVVLDWNDTFQDESGIIYKITLSDNEHLHQGENTYEFWTKEGSGSTFTLNNSTPGCPVGIFEKMQKVYWRVEVYDSNYNQGVVSGIYSFDFKIDDVDGYLSANDERPAKPEDIDVILNKVDECHTDMVGLSWETANTCMGIYSYTIELLDSKGKVVYSGNTVDITDRLATDINPLVEVKSNDSSNTMTIKDLRKFFGKAALEDGTYKVVVSSVDAYGRVSKSSGDVKFTLDTVRPAAVNVFETKAVGTSENGNSYSTLILKWDAVKDASGIDHYEVKYRQRTADEEPGEWQIVNDPKQITVKDNVVTFAMDVSLLYSYDFRVVAIDKAGNRGVEWPVDEVVNVKPLPDKFSDYVDKEVQSIGSFNNGRLTASAGDTVGRGDKADCFKIQTLKSAAINITATDLGLVFGDRQTVKVDIYEGENLKKVWKSYTVKSAGWVASDLLLQAGISYTFKVSAVDQNSIAEYNLNIAGKELGGAGNDNTDDTLANILENTQEIKKYSMILSESADQAASDGNWVGYGDFSDIKILSFKTTGRYTFSLSNVAAQAVLTVYEVVKKTNAKGEVVTSYKKVTSVTANQTKLDGVTSKEVVLEAGKEYFYEVKIGNKKLVGTEYKVTVNCIDSYPGATEYDNLLAADKTKFAGQTLELNKELTEDKSNAALWVGAGDKVDYFMLTDDSVKELNPEELYQLKLDGIEGNNIKVAIGYLDAKGQFKQIMSKTGAKNAEALIMHCNFTYEHLSKGQLYVQVSANGKNGNSRYSLSMTPYSKIQGRDNTDDTAEVTQKKLEEDVTRRDWVGFGDNTDFVKLDLTVDGLYQFTVSKVANNVTVDVLKKVTAANGAISYVKVDTLKATASKNAVTGKLLMLDASEEYYVSVTAPGANKGNNSDYELIMSMLERAVNLGRDENLKTYDEEDPNVIIEGTVAQNYVYTAAELGGAYEFTLDNTDATGSVKLTVYELLDNGKKRTVKSITVKAGAEGSTGYLWLDDDVVKNGTGIYQVEIKGTGKKVEGNVEYSVNGYGFAQYLTETAVDDKNNGLKVTDPAKPGEMTANKDWVGMGDASDSYKYTVNNVGVHEFTLEGINGNNIKLTIMDSRGKVLKKFTGANKADFASFAYEFKATGDYTILVEAAGKNKFSEYTLSAYDRVADAAKLDDTTAMLGNAKAWDKSDTSKLVLVKDEDPANAVDHDVEGWVGAGDAKDFYGIVINASGNYDLNISNLDNNVKVTLYEATAWNTFDNSIKSGKAVKSVTATADGTADGTASLSGFYLDANKNYYVVVQATSTNGSKNSEYKLDLQATAEIDATEKTGTVTKTDPDAYTFTAINGAYDVTLTLEDGDKAVVTLYKVNPANGKYIKVKSVTATSKNDTVNTGDLSLEVGFSYVVEVTAPNAKNGKSVGYTLNVNHWSFATTDNNRNDNDLANAILLPFEGNTAKSSNDAVWRVGKDKTAWDAVDYYKVEVSESGAYSLKLDGINGNTVKVTIGTLTDKGKFKAVQSVTGKAGSTELLLSRELDANTYYVKVESVKNDTGSEYTLELTNNEKRAGFSNENDTWKQVAGDIDSVAFGDNDTIKDWVGFGDAVDVFKIRLNDIADRYDDNGQVVFSGIGATANALIDKEIKLSLVDANGKSVALTFDKESGSYTSKNILMAGADYYLTVKNSNAKKQNIDYDIDISLAQA